MLLSISAWVETQDAVSLASVYDSNNKSSEVLSLLPNIIVDVSKLEQGKSYTQFQIPYNMYLDILNAEKRKEIPVNDLAVLKNVIDITAQFNVHYDLIYRTMQKLKDTPSIGIMEALQDTFNLLLNSNYNNAQSS